MTLIIFGLIQAERDERQKFKKAIIRVSIREYEGTEQCLCNSKEKEAWN